MSLSNTSVLILINHSETNSIKYDVFVNNSFNIRNTQLYKSDQLYNIFFFVSFISDTVIRE